MIYTIGICGVSGGSCGPNGLYDLLKIKYGDKFIEYETIRANEQLNTLKVIEIINKILINEPNSKFNLIGYSMGGTVCLYLGLYFKKYNCINKIIFCSTQTIGFENLNNLNCKIIFFHPHNDDAIPFKYVYKLYELYPFEKNFYSLSKCNHCWENVNLIKIINLIEKS
jgi:hypothetical protein